MIRKPSVVSIIMFYVFKLLSAALSTIEAVLGKGNATFTVAKSRFRT